MPPHSSRRYTSTPWRCLPRTQGGASVWISCYAFPQLLRGVMLHEPVLPFILRHPEHVIGPVQAAIFQGFQAKGLPGGVEAVLRYVAGDAAMAAIPSQTLERLLQNADTVFGIERSEKFANWCPTKADLAAVQVPVAVLMGRESLGFFGEMVNWLAPRLNTPVITAPGGHAAYFDHGSELAETLRPILRRWSAP